MLPATPPNVESGPEERPPHQSMAPSRPTSDPKSRASQLALTGQWPPHRLQAPIERTRLVGERGRHLLDPRLRAAIQQPWRNQLGHEGLPLGSRRLCSVECSCLLNRGTRPRTNSAQRSSVGSDPTTSRVAGTPRRGRRKTWHGSGSSWGGSASSSRRLRLDRAGREATPIERVCRS